VVFLDESERASLRRAVDNLVFLRRDEESKWAQRAKVKYIQEGRDNTKYFHLVANMKNRKKRIFQLEQDEGTIVSQENIKTYISEYYKSLIGVPISSECNLVESANQDIPQLSQEENNILIADSLNFF
jgi:hypothetical protein